MRKPDLAIVPVIDIKHGVVVRARAGERQSYAPIVSPFSRTADPVAIARGLLDLTGAHILYVADLDGIEGRGRDRATVTRLAAACPDTQIWVDAGFAMAHDLDAFAAEGCGRAVVGSESQTDAALLGARRDRMILSLDFRGEAFLGPREILDMPSLWPDDLIVMTLARVGTGQGPDLARLAAVKARAPYARVYAAGGLRGPEDLALLAEAGAAGILVASALHDGRLRPEHLA